MEFVEDAEFTKKAAKLLTEDELMELENTLLLNPDAGEEIGGGLRKIRIQRKGKGKSGGHRVIYFWYMQRELIRFLDIFTKNEKENISKIELKNLRNKTNE